MTRKFFSAGLSIASFALILCALAATLGMQLLGDLKTYVQISLKNVEKSTGYRITLDDIGWDILEGSGIRVDNLALYDKSGTRSLLECRKVHVKFDLLPLMKARLIISRIELDGPHITMYRDTTGDLTLPPLSVPADTGSISRLDAFSDFSIALKRFTVNGGSIHFDDRLRNAVCDLHDITLQLLRDKKPGTFGITLRAQQSPGEGGLLAFNGVFQGIDPQGRPDRLSGTGDLTLTAARLRCLVPYLYDNATVGELRSSLNASLAIKLEPEWQFSLNGTIDSDNMSAPLPGGKIAALGKSSLLLSAQASTTRLLLDSYRLSLADNATLAGKCSLTRMNESSVYVELKCSSNKIPVAAVGKLIDSFEAVPMQVKSLLHETRQGSIMLTDAHMLASFDRGTGRTTAKLTGSIQLFDALTHFSPGLPPLYIRHGMFQLRDNETLDAAVSANWPGTDNHTLRGNVTSVFHEPKITVHADSVLHAESLQAILKTAAPALEEKISMQAGSISAKTQLDYKQQWQISTSIDFQQAALTAYGRLSKPASIPLLLEIKTSLAKDLTVPLPLTFAVINGDSFHADGTVKSWEPLSCSGTYHAENFSLSAFEIPDIKGLIHVSGTVSGDGTWKLPAKNTGDFPVTGTCRLNDFSMISTSSGKLLVGGNLDGAFESSMFKIFSCRAAMGETHGTFSGGLTSLLPPRGRLDIVAELFDIDDFITVIDHFIAVKDQLKMRETISDPPAQNPTMLTETDLYMPLKLRRLNLWNWDLDNGTSLWTFKNGVMDWDNITLIGGGGPISGTVQFDLSKMPIRTLTLSPTRSHSDFLFVVPALRKNRTITGTMNMSGWFSSTFSRKEDLGRNMAGKFHVDVVDGKIQKLTIISKILELMNLGNLFNFISEDILSTGMPYDSIKADFTVDHAVMKTENLQLKGPAMNLSAVGTINMRTDEMNLIIGAEILETFGKIVGAIPIAGSIVTGRDKTITLAYFKATGNYQEGTVLPMPVKSLGAPILKVINSLMYFPKKLIHATGAPDNQSMDNASK